MTDAVGDAEFTSLNRQLVRHRDGWTVGSSGRYAVQYQDSSQTVLAGVERGDVYWLYGDSLMLLAEDGTQTPLPQRDLPTVVDRLVRGLAALGVRTEVHTQPSTAGQPIHLTRRFTPRGAPR